MTTMDVSFMIGSDAAAQIDVKDANGTSLISSTSVFIVMYLPARSVGIGDYKAYYNLS